MKSPEVSTEVDVCSDALADNLSNVPRMIAPAHDANDAAVAILEERSAFGVRQDHPQREFRCRIADGPSEAVSPQVGEEPLHAASMRLTGEFVYCAAIGHRQIVKLSEAKQLPDGRYVCLTCFQGQMTLERGQRIKGEEVRPNGHATL